MTYLFKKKLKSWRQSKGNSLRLETTRIYTLSIGTLLSLESSAHLWQKKAGMEQTKCTEDERESLACLIGEHGGHRKAWNTGINRKWAPKGGP